MVLEYRFADYQPQRLPELAAELVRLKLDVIVAITNAPAFAASGGNLTGVESLAPERDAKRLELLKALAPSVARVGAVFNANAQGARRST